MKYNVIHECSLVSADGGPIFSSSLYLSACDGELNSIRMALSMGDLTGLYTHTWDHMISCDVIIDMSQQQTVMSYNISS